MKHQRGHISWEWVDRRLRADRSIWIATVRPNGRPHAVPVWFWWDGEAIYFITLDRTQKGRNLASRSHVVLHLGDGDDAIIIEGRADAVSGHDEQARVDAGYQGKYIDPYSGAHASIHDNPGDRLYRVRPDRVLAWMYGVVATRTDWVAV